MEEEFDLLDEDEEEEEQEKSGKQGNMEQCVDFNRWGFKKPNYFEDYYKNYDIQKCKYYQKYCADVMMGIICPSEINECCR